MSLFCPLCSTACSPALCNFCQTSGAGKCSGCSFAPVYCFHCKAKYITPSDVIAPQPLPSLTSLASSAEDESSLLLARSTLEKLVKFLQEEAPNQNIITETLRILVSQCKNVRAMRGQKQILAELVNTVKLLLTGDPGPFSDTVNTLRGFLQSPGQKRVKPIILLIAEKVKPIQPVIRRPCAIKKHNGSVPFTWKNDDPDGWAGSLRSTLAGGAGSLRTFGKRVGGGLQKEPIRKVPPGEQKPVIQKRRPESVMLEFNLKYGSAERKPLSSGPESIRQLLEILRSVGSPLTSNEELISAASRLLADIGDVQARTSIDLSPPSTTSDQELVGNVVSHAMSVLEELLRSNHSSVIDAFVYNQLVHSIEKLKKCIQQQRTPSPPISPPKVVVPPFSPPKMLTPTKSPVKLVETPPPTRDSPPREAHAAREAHAQPAIHELTNSPRLAPPMSAPLSRARSQRDVHKPEGPQSPVVGEEAPSVRDKVRIFSHRRSKSLGKLKELVAPHNKGVELFTPPSPPSPGSTVDLLWIGDKKQFPARFFSIPSAVYTLLYCHDLHEDVGSNLEWWFTLRDALPVNLFVVEYPGYGSVNKVKPSEKGCIAAVQAALTHILALTSRVAILAKGLAAAFALAVAGPHPVILQNPASTITLPDFLTIPGFDAQKKARFCSGPSYMIVDQLSAEASALKVLLKPLNFRTLTASDNPERNASDDYLADLRDFFQQIAVKAGVKLPEPVLQAKPRQYESSEFLQSVLKPIGLSELIVDFLSNGYTDQESFLGITREELALVVAPQHREVVWDALARALPAPDLSFLPEPVDLSTRPSDPPPPPPPQTAEPEPEPLARTETPPPPPPFQTLEPSPALAVTPDLPEQSPALTTPEPAPQPEPNQAEAEKSDKVTKIVAWASASLDTLQSVCRNLIAELRSPNRPTSLSVSGAKAMRTIRPDYLKLKELVAPGWLAPALPFPLIETDDKIQIIVNLALEQAHKLLALLDDVAGALPNYGVGELVKLGALLKSLLPVLKDVQ